MNNTKPLEKVRRRTRISDLPGDLVREIFSRVPLTSLSLVRSTCKTWNASSENQILGQKAGARMDQCLEFTIVDYKLCSLRFDLQGILNDDKLADPSIKQISIPNHHQVEISQVYHCDGLLLCVPRNHSRRLLVWNPYLGQTRLIQPTNSGSYTYALGYDDNRNHKILRYRSGEETLQVYDFSSDSWRLLGVNPLYIHHIGVSLKGNTYFLGRREEIEATNIEYNLVCFDFTTESFGRPLLLPYKAKFRSVVLFWARDEKLAVLYYLRGAVEIWITAKIEPNVVSWNTFLRLDLRQVNGLQDKFLTCFEVCSFFIDEKKKVSVLITRHIQDASVPNGMHRWKRWILQICQHHQSMSESLGSWQACVLFLCSEFSTSSDQPAAGRNQRKKPTTGQKGFIQFSY